MSETTNTKQKSRGGFGPGSGGGGPHGQMITEKPKNFKATLKRLVNYFGKSKFAILIVLIMAVGSTAFVILGPRMLGNATTTLYDGISNKLNGGAIDFGRIGQILLTVTAIYVISALLSYVQNFIMAGVSQKVTYTMRREVKEKLDTLPLKYFDQHSHGDILSRVTNDIDTISNTLQQSLTQIITALSTIIGVTIIMFSMSWILALVTLFILPFAAFITSFVVKRSQRYFKGQQRELGAVNGHVEEMFGGHTVIKAYGKEADAIEKFDEINERLYKVSWRAQFMAHILMPLMTMINNFSYVIICVIGGVMVINGSLAIGEVQAFIQYSRNFSQPIAQVAQIANVIQSTIAAAERVYEVLDEKEEISDESSKQSLTNVRGSVHFDQISFGYNEDIPIIKNLSLSVDPGKVIAIVGPTGAGKTTLVNLLMRFYDVDSGTIHVDGVDIRDVKRKNLRDQYGMVLQDTWLFNGTIKDNIAYGREDATLEEIVEAAKMARADRFIRRLPEGYDTVLNEEATNISQGQKQLLTIARALLANPRILILDEATSSVDTRTEAYIQQAMITLMEGRTNFVIAHRLSTIKEADTILVMNNGEVIEQGNHEALLKQEGFYADLYQSQFTSADLRDNVG